MIKVALSSHFDNKKPRTIERVKKLAIEQFKEKGETSHSGMAMLLPFVINYCEENKIRYTLTAIPGCGYHLKSEEVLP